MMPKNVFGSELTPCCMEPETGFYRDGYCRTGSEDEGMHIVCAEMTSEFLKFSRDRGNDLTTPNREIRFPGLKPGDRWCICVNRWSEAMEAGVAPWVDLEATNISVLEFVELEYLKVHDVRLKKKTDR